MSTASRKTDWPKPAPELELPLHAFAWQPQMNRARISRGALYLIRPDGYVALADPDARPERLRQYFSASGPGGAVGDVA